jgi:putative endonuclease
MDVNILKNDSKKGSNGMNPVRHWYYTYVLKSEKTGQYYTGATNNLENRVLDHNGGKVVSTKNRGPFELIYFEACLNKSDAFRREKYLKTGMGKRYIKNRLEGGLTG